MTEQVNIFTLLMTALVFENAFFSRALDASVLLVIPFKKKGAWVFGACLTAVTAVCAGISVWVSRLFVNVEGAAFYRPAAYIVTLGALYLVVCVALYVISRKWMKEHGAFLSLLFFNSAAYGAMALTVYGGFVGVRAFVYGAGIGLSFLLALFLVEQGRKSLKLCNLPKAFVGLPAELVYVGILALALYGLVGHQLAH